MQFESPRESLVTSLGKLYHHISPRRRSQFRLLLVLTLVCSVAEIFSLGSIVPFVGIFTQPDLLLVKPIMKEMLGVLGIHSTDAAMLAITIAFIGATLISGALRLLLLWVTTQLGNATGTDIGIEVFRRTLHQPFEVHIARNSSDIIANITQKVGITSSLLLSLVNLISSTILFLVILCVLLVIDPVVTVLTALFFGACYGMIIRVSRERMRINGELISEELPKVQKSLQEGLGAILNVLLDGTQAIYSEIYSRSAQKLRVVTCENVLVSQGPRFVMETLGIVLIATLTFALSRRTGGVGAALPVIGALAVGAQRLLPLLQQSYGNFVNLISSQASLSSVLEMLDQPISNESYDVSPLPFERQLRLDGVSFRYGQDKPWVLSGADLSISKGMRIGVVGSTGSGKSTMLDILMGLLAPTQGSMTVDDREITEQSRRAWQKNIAHVPQMIYLSDSTLAENIAFGVPRAEIDMRRVRMAAEQAQIADHIESMPEQYSAMVGERGIRLSGGQRQRIGIARALYKQANLLIFDEATSALDNSTEHSVMHAISNLDSKLTIVLVAHRISTVQACDMIIELANGKIVAKGTYDELLRNSQSFRDLTRLN